LPDSVDPRAAGDRLLINGRGEGDQSQIGGAAPAGRPGLGAEVVFAREEPPCRFRDVRDV